MSSSVPIASRFLKPRRKRSRKATTPRRLGTPRLRFPVSFIERELGRGAASVVYLAWEPALDRHVAVKLFPSNSLVDPHAREHWLG